MQALYECIILLQVHCALMMSMNALIQTSVTAMATALTPEAALSVTVSRTTMATPVSAPTLSLTSPHPMFSSVVKRK